MKGFKRTVLTAGFAMFSMFFGSGNLVFPLAIGVQTVDKAPVASLGLMLTGVLVPFLGLIGVILFAGNRANFFACIGKWPAFALTLTMLSLMGPLGVIPRCILVAFGGVHLILPALPFWLFNALFCGILVFLVWQHDKIVPIIGKILTPWLILGVIVLSFFGLRYGPSLGTTDLAQFEAFKLSALQAYQTMDLLAAFFFSATTVAYLRRQLRSDDPPELLLRLSLASSVIGGALLAAVYVSFVFLGAKFSSVLAGYGKEAYLATIATETLGPMALPVAAVVILLACLTTATVLVMLFAHFFNEEVTHEYVSYRASVLITIGVSFVFSMMGFDKLSAWIAQALEIAYPALIALTVANLAKQLAGIDVRKVAFYGVLAASVVVTCVN